MQPRERVVGCPHCGRVSGFKVVVLDPSAPDPMEQFRQQRVWGKPTVMRFDPPERSELERLADLLIKRSG
jgi:hypothetical protein